MVCWSRFGADGCEGLGHMATGSWSRDIFKHVKAEQEHASQRALLIEQILAGGIRSDMWMGVKSGNECACYKQSNKQSDAKCGSCYGERYVPGYLKFGYDTVWMSATDSDVTLTGVEITKTFKSAKVVLTSTSTSGTIESGDKSFSRTAFGSTWESQALSFVRIEGQSNVVVEYSLDSGIIWDDIDNLATVNPSSGNIRFKATLTRDTTSIITPAFEIVRARYARIDLSSGDALGGADSEKSDCGEYRFGPWVLLMRSIPISRNTKGEHADLPVQDNLKVWTAGFSLFDPTIEIGSEDEYVKDNKVLFEIKDGVQTGSRYKVTSWSPSDPFAYVIVQQTMDIRYVDPVGPFSLVW